MAPTKKTIATQEMSDGREAAEPAWAQPGAQMSSLKALGRKLSRDSRFQSQAD
jgi:hypothetical protein